MNIQRKPLLVGFALLLFAALIGVLFWWQPTAPPGHRTLDSDNPRPGGGDFTLQSANGPVSLSDFRGKVVLLYFGYTLCPDVCPTNLAVIAKALEHLSPGELARVQVIFISVDPQRDELPRLKTYAEYFHPNMLGVTGDPETVARAAEKYGVVYQRRESGSALGYMVDHSAFTYLVGPGGELREILPHASPPPRIVQAIRHLLAGDAGGGPS